MTSNQIVLNKKKEILTEEENSIIKILDKFKSQLNRLKIEELALMSLIRMQGPSAEASATGVGNSGTFGRASAPISVGSASTISSSSSIIPVGVVEHPSSISVNSQNDQEILDLTVEDDMYNIKQGEMDLKEFEEEDEEDEEQMDDYTFMDLNS